MTWARFDIAEIERTLADTAAVPDDRWVELGEEEMTPDTVRRMADGYRYVDAWLSAKLDVFAYGNSKYLLELNHRVLCGVTEERRLQFADHIEETRKHFYDDARGGIAVFAEWYRANRARPPRFLAAGMLVRVVSHPQLFIEGNTRTGALLAGYCLARAGLPPLVTTDRTIKAFHDLIERCLVMHRTGLMRVISASMLTYQIADFLRREAEPRFLLAPGVPGTAPEALVRGAAREGDAAAWMPPK